MKEINPFEIDTANIKMPPIIESSKSPTLNGMGYIFFGLSPLAEDFLDNEALPHKKVLEIGAGYSNLTIEALKRNVGFYTANDMAEGHLKILVARIKEIFKDDTLHKLKSLKLNCGKVPQDLDILYQQYDAIILDKVLHFMPPNDIIEFVSWTKQALKPQGKLYLTISTPYSKTLRKRLDEYLLNQSKGSLFPGHFRDIQQSLDSEVVEQNPLYKIPDEIVLFTRADLVKFFEKQDMQVLRSYSLKKPDSGEFYWSEVKATESDLAGIIVMPNLGKQNCMSQAI